MASDPPKVLISYNTTPPSIGNVCWAWPSDSARTAWMPREINTSLGHQKKVGPGGCSTDWTGPILFWLFALRPTTAVSAATNCRALVKERTGKEISSRLRFTIRKVERRNFVPILFKSGDETFIPEPLGGQNCYVLDSEEKYDNLYAFPVGQSGVLARKLGLLKTLAHNPAETLRFGNSEVVRKAMGKLYGVPDLPPHYLTREANFAGLKQKLVAEGVPVAITKKRRSSTV
jgi:hypothetical protein